MKLQTSAFALPLLLSPGMIDDRVDALFARFDVPGSPGAAVAVIQDGEVVLADGYGSAQLEYEAPITPDTVFHVASVSKQFTCFAVCLLAADGKLSLDDSVRQYIPEVPDFGTPITLKHLMHHTSGLRDQWETLAVAGWRLDDVITTEHILTMVANQKELNFEPGSEHLYCNTGYTLLGEVVARVSGTTFPEFCRRRIFEPLGMERTHFHDDIRHVVPGRAYSYAQTSEGFENAVLSYANAGATSLFTTAVDLLLWLQNLGTGEVGGGTVQAMMREPYVLNDGTIGAYALGLFLEDLGGHRALSHSGGDAGFNAHVVWFPDQDLGVAVLANHGIGASDYANRVARLFLGEAPARTPSVAAASAPSPAPATLLLEEEALECYVGLYADENGAPARVSRQAGELVLEGGGLPARLQPLSETEFVVRDTGAHARFLRSRAGAVTGLVVSQQGTRRSLRRLAHEPVDSPYEEYVGRYWSEELGTFYDLESDHRGLVARHRRHGTIPLSKQGPDAYQGSRWFFGRLHFRRDEEGRVDGFLLSGGRVRNLAFQRVE